MPGRIHAVLGELALEVIHLAHDQPRVVQQTFARRGDFHAPTVAVQQARVELAFQRLDPRTRGGGREERTLGALGQAGGFGDMDKQAQVGEIEVHGGSWVYTNLITLKIQMWERACSRKRRVSYR